MLSNRLALGRPLLLLPFIILSTHAFKTPLVEFSIFCSIFSALVFMICLIGGNSHHFLSSSILVLSINFLPHISLTLTQIRFGEVGNFFEMFEKMLKKIAIKMGF